METNENREKMYCCWCSRELTEDDYTFEYNGETLCETCYDNDFLECEICGNITPIGETEFTNSHGYVCDTCFERNFYYCEDCNENYHYSEWDADHECCIRCAEQYHVLPDYHSHDFYPIGTPNEDTLEFFKGVELEIDTDDYSINRRELVDGLNYIANRRVEHIVFERDGSLNHGIEIISHPHTISEFNKIPWNQIMIECKEYGFTSHDIGSCGLHIHYSKEWFGLDTDTQDENIAKLILFYEKHFSDFLKLSRRTEQQYKRWCDRYYTAHIGECIDVVKGKSDGRYRAINICNRDTVEFRLGRGTLKIESFKAWNDIHDNLVRNCKYITLSNINNPYMWLDGITAETIEYIKSKDAFRGYYSNTLEEHMKMTMSELYSLIKSI